MPLILPYQTPEKLNISGVIKQSASDFEVTEIPLYLPEGRGEHVYVTLRYKNKNTKDLQRELKKIFLLDDRDIGVAGLKDKHATVTQAFSLRLPQRDVVGEVIDKIKNNPDIDVIKAQRHVNKLKMGHLLGNHFKIVVSQTSANALQIADEINQHLKILGLANFFGVQRFGVKKDNAIRGKECLLGIKKIKDRWMKRLMLSAYTSDLFNRYLVKRIDNNLFDCIAVGDIAKKIETGGLFEVDNISCEQERFDNQEIMYTGPIFGSKMKMSTGLPGKIERDMFDDEGLNQELFKKNKVPGSRRVGRIFVNDLQLDKHPDGIVFEFTLPKGSYATVLLREFIKNGEL